jgi:predicted transcriptional regulator
MQTKALMSLAECAKALGVSERTIRRLVTARRNGGRLGGGEGWLSRGLVYKCGAGGSGRSGARVGRGGMPGVGGGAGDAARGGVRRRQAAREAVRSVKPPRARSQRSREAR